MLRGLLVVTSATESLILPVVSEWREGRANELMSAECFEDEKTFSSV